SLDGEAAGEVVLLVGFIKLFRQRVRGRRFVQTDQAIEPSGDDVACLRHQVFSECAAGVRETMFMARTGGVQKQPRSLNGVTGNNYGTGALKTLAFVPV